MRYAPIANSADGLGGKLAGAEPKWYGFGYPRLPQAEIGFALAAPVLRMREGLRTVTVTLALGAVDHAAVHAGSLKDAFDVFITGEKSWLGPYTVSPSITAGNVLTFTFTVPESEKAVIDYNAAIHGYAYVAQAPVIQVLLKEGSAIGYNELRDVALLNAAVSVDVSNVTSLSLESDNGTLDPKKAFLPFGPQPAKGSRFLVGYSEALAKKLSEVKISVTWKGAPANFATYYSDYKVAGISNDYFTAAVSFNDGGSWHYAQTGVKLFESASAAAGHTFSFVPAHASVASGITAGMQVYALNNAGSRWAMNAAGAYLLRRPVFAPYKTAAPESRPGFITFSLERNFLHAAFRKKYVQKVMQYSKEGSGTPVILNEPYTPAVQGISLSYKAHSATVNIGSASVMSDDFSNPDLQFFHISYFGQMREHRYQRQQFRFLTDKSVSLLPAYDNEGELLVGFDGLQPGDSVSVLFQVAEGSADPELKQEQVNWSVLCDNYWRPLARNEMVLDTTNQLLASGIITFVIPREATTANTVLPTGCIWLKAAVAQNVTAVCQLIDVAANAVEARFIDQGNDPDHLRTALEKGSIIRLRSGLSAVKSVKQPYASFGGRAVESDAAFHTRVSERLRHKNRCITPWDYERLILAGFPRVHKVKCIPHATPECWLAPGNVLIVVIPDLRNKNGVDPLQPKVDADTISRITAHVQKRAGMQVTVRVKNPRYQKVMLDFKVRFRAGCEFNYYCDELNRAMIRFLSPWAYEADRDITFGGRVYRSVLLDFVEELEYVDYVTDFKMYSFTGTTMSTIDRGETQPDTPDAILVSAEKHTIHEA